VVIGIGTDIVEVERVQRIWERHGDRFAGRILTPAEQAQCATTAEPWRFLAKRFAAKEAISKCLGTGIGVALSWQDLELLRDADGAPLVQLSHRAGALAARRGGARVLVSLSDERAYAVAFAILLA
jgi:holo-[acyl-carrier protein] synthase